MKTYHLKAGVYFIMKEKGVVVSQCFPLPCFRKSCQWKGKNASFNNQNQFILLLHQTHNPEFFVEIGLLWCRLCQRSCQQSSIIDLWRNQQLIENQKQYSFQNQKKVSNQWQNGNQWSTVCSMSFQFQPSPILNVQRNHQLLPFCQNQQFSLPDQEVQVNVGSVHFNKKAKRTFQSHRQSFQSQSSFFQLVKQKSKEWVGRAG